MTSSPRSMGERIASGPEHPHEGLRPADRAMGRRVKDRRPMQEKENRV